jgi:RHS repeat-associated protein
VHHAYAKRALMKIPSLDDWEKDWQENPQRSTQPKLLPVDFFARCAAYSIQACGCFQDGRPTAVLHQTPAPDHFPVAAPPVRSDSRENDEWPSPQTRHGVAGHCGSLAPLPGTDCCPSKPETKCVNHFSENMVSQLTWSHRDDNLGLYYNRARYLNPDTGRFWTMDTDEGADEDPLSLRKYLYTADNPINLDDPSGNDYGAFDINLSTIFLPFLKVPMLAGSIINATGASALNPTGLPVKALNDADIDGQLNSVYHKIRQWEKMPGHGPVPNESWSVFVSMMAGSTVDTIYYRTPAGQNLYQYNGTEHPLLLEAIS